MTAASPFSLGRVACFMDLETWALEDAEAFIDMRDIAAPANYKDADKIADYVTKAKAARLQKAALDFDLARIAIAGTLTPRGGEEADDRWIARATTADEEYEVVRTLLALCNDPEVLLVGHNLLGYDLPLIDRRALEFGLPPMGRRRAPKYRAEDYGIFDIQEVLSEGRPDRWRSLEWYIARYLPGLVIEDPLPHGGADVGLALQEGRWDDVEGHLRADLTRSHALYERIHGVSAVWASEAVGE